MSFVLVLLDDSLICMIKGLNLNQIKCALLALFSYHCIKLYLFIIFLTVGT